MDGRTDGCGCFRVAKKYFKLEKSLSVLSPHLAGEHVGGKWQEYFLLQHIRASTVNWCESKIRGVQFFIEEHRVWRFCITTVPAKFRGEHILWEKKSIGNFMVMTLFAI